MNSECADEQEVRDSLLHDYRRSLCDYLDHGGEDELTHAYDIGRVAVGRGLGVVEVALLHLSVVSELALSNTPAREHRSAQFLAEMLAPFELTHRGFREANQRLAQLNQQLLDKNRELERSAHELSLANGRAREANRELEAFSHSVAHDLRSPLNAVIGFAELLAQHQTEPVMLEFAEEIVKAGRGMNRLIETLLEFAHGARGEIQKTQVDLSQIAERVLSRLRLQGAYTRAQVRIQPALHASADPALIEIALTNLLSNALKYSARRDEPRIELGRLAAEAPTQVFFIRDNGAGFDMAEAGQLFSAFQRLRTAQPFEGHGVGLATVQRIIHRHGGDIWAKAVVDQGATFFFTLG